MDVQLEMLSTRNTKASNSNHRAPKVLSVNPSKPWDESNYLEIILFTALLRSASFKIKQFSTFYCIIYTTEILYLASS